MKAYLAPALMITLAALLTTLSACKDSREVQPEYGGQAGMRLPLFELPDENNNVRTNSDFKGKMVVLEFWASWCSYCQAEVEEMRELHQLFKDKNTAVIGISLDKNRQNWLKSLAMNDLEYTQLIDTAGFDAAFARACSVDQIPHMILTDENGIILKVSQETSGIRSFLEQILP